jgi:hypothetical protein
VDQKTVLLEQAETLVSRLERLSADSIWAHRVSGYRGALLRSIEKVKGDDGTAQQIEIEEPVELLHLEKLLVQGYILLEKAARELIR